MCHAVANHDALEQLAVSECAIPYPDHMVWYDYLLQTGAAVERFVAYVCHAVGQEYIGEVKTSGKGFSAYAHYGFG